MFGSNLRKLAERFVSISELSRQLGINRTQFNRYLAGESFPRPDVLARICDFFDVDARVLLEPVENIGRRGDLFSTDAVKPFLENSVYGIPDAVFPSGFYRFSRRSFIDQAKYVVGLVRVWRGENGATYVRGYETRDALKAQGLPVSREMREFRGFVMLEEDGVAAIIKRRGAKTGSFNYLNRVPAMENNYWLGYVSRTVPEVPGADRIVRMVYEHVGTGLGNAKAAAKTTGYRDLEDLLPFHQRLLKPDQPFF